MRQINAVQDKTEIASEIDQKSTQKPSPVKMDIEVLSNLTEQNIAAVMRLSGHKDRQKFIDNNVFKYKTFQEHQNKEYYINLLTENFNTSYYNMLVGSIEISFLSEVDDILARYGGNNEAYFL